MIFTDLEEQPADKILALMSAFNDDPREQKLDQLVAGEGRACTDLMRAAEGKVVLKTGAEGFFVAIIPEKKMGVALKVLDGATRASESVIASINFNQTKRIRWHSRYRTS